jgi:hypothetical protein
MSTRWTPESWRTKAALHMPADYPDPHALTAVEDELRALPPLVFAGEARRLKDRLAQVEADWLEQRFGRTGPYWSRHYRFFRNGRPLTVIREVFSPQLERWLGPAIANGSVDDRLQQVSRVAANGT